MERDTWYANCIATDPVYQERGLATAIVDRVLADAAEMHSVVALGTQSEKNVSVVDCFIFQAKREMSRPRSIGNVDLSSAAGWTPTRRGVPLREIYSRSSLIPGAAEARRVAPHRDANRVAGCTSLFLFDQRFCAMVLFLIHGGMAQCECGDAVGESTRHRSWVVKRAHFSRAHTNT